jgi:hypothetical protein
LARSAKSAIVMARRNSHAAVRARGRRRELTAGVQWWLGMREYPLEEIGIV